MITELTGLLERESIISNALHHAKRRRVVILQGVIGSGKTALLEHVATVYAQSSKIPPLYIQHCTPYKQFLLDILYQLYRRGCLDENKQSLPWEELYKELNRAHSRETRTLIYTAFEAWPDLMLVVDNIDQSTQAGISLFRHLLEASEPPQLICTATTINRLKYLVWQAELITIPNLSKKATSIIVDSYVKTHGLIVESPKMFRQQIFNISAGNPLAIATKLKYCRYEPKIRKHLLTGHDRSSGRNQLDMSFIIIIIFVLAMMNRYISRALGDTNLYMLSSIVAALTIGGRFILFKGGNAEEV